MKKLLSRIYHSFISWRSVTKFGNDFFIEINNDLYSLIMLKPHEIGKHELEKIYDTYNSCCTMEDNLKLLNTFKCSKNLKNSFILFFDTNGKLLCLCNNYSQGFERINDFDKVYYMNQKKLRAGFQNNFFYLKKITIKKT